MVTSPTIGLLGAFLIMNLLLLLIVPLVARAREPHLSPAAAHIGRVRRLAHGSNDAQKTMGVITLALITLGPPAPRRRRSPAG